MRSERWGGGAAREAIRRAPARPEFHFSPITSHLRQLAEDEEEPPDAPALRPDAPKPPTEERPAVEVEEKPLDRETDERAA